MKAIIIFMAVILSGCSMSNIMQKETLSGHFLKGEKAYAQKEYKQARQHYLKVTDQQPANLAALFKLGNISMHEKDWGSAMKYYHIVLKIRPSHEKANHNLAMLHLHQAKNYLSYYIANANNDNNQSMGKLIEAITDYSSQQKIVTKKTALDELADIVEQ